MSARCSWLFSLHTRACTQRDIERAAPVSCSITRNASYTLKNEDVMETAVEQKPAEMEEVAIDDTASTTAEKVIDAAPTTAEEVIDTALPTPEDDFADGLTSSPQPQTPTEVTRPHFEHTLSSPQQSEAPVSPISPAEADYSQDMYGRDSMASIALSESSLDYDHLSADQVEAALATPRVQSRHMRRPSSLEILQNAWPPRPGLERHSTLFDSMKDELVNTPGSDREEGEAEVVDDDETDVGSPSSLATASMAILPARGSSLATPRKSSGSSFEEQTEVDWQQLDKNEEQEREDLPAGAEDESTAFLLARLEQENAKITAATQVAVNKNVKNVARMRSESRPPSMGHLKKLVQDRNVPSVRYSMASTEMSIPESPVEPPPMTELEFWAALVQDYPSTASRLPTLTTTKIRSGIPPPLRGVVWTSMAGARERSLEIAFEKLQSEKSPYEGIINKDVGRSFPGVELFRDAEGEGQRMLGRVLSCFSLQDKDIGYCQGLGFLVGPLLMNMDERSAFCCLVRLMDTYNLRPSFLPSLSGLHMRIYQFSALLKQHQAELSAHLTAMGVEPAYLSQWFLSCFAVTCPLPMLFRIYDVIFAEGANETVMRVALALMRRNEAKMMETTEFEDVMQLLLGRGIWDCYGLSADELVDDFTSLGGIITHVRLAELEKEFESQSSESVGEKAGFLPDVQAAASRFLGRLWAPSGGHAPNKSTSTLSPHAAEKDAPTRGSYLRRSPSKQSISTLNESTGSSDTTSSGSTAHTDMDTHDRARESQTETMSFKSQADSMRTVSMSTGHYIPGPSKEERDMHGQIEDLLTALSEMQREHAQLAAMFQREREERGDDHRVVRQLVNRLRKGGDEENDAISVKEDRRRTLPPPPKLQGLDVDGGKQRPKSWVVVSKGDQEKEELDGLLEKVNERLQTNARSSASFETKAQLRDRLTRTREQLHSSESSCRNLTARLEIAESSLAAYTSETEDLRAEVKELRDRVNEEFKARQKLDHTIRELKAEARTIDRKDRERVQRAESSEILPKLSRRDSARRESKAPNFTFPIVTDSSANVARRGSVTGSPVKAVGANGLRELKLVRRESASSVQSLRSVRAQRLERQSPPEIQIQTHQQPAVAARDSTEDVVAGGPSPPTINHETAPETPIAETPVSVVSTPVAALASPALAVPAASPWHARTSSLATREVFATPQHEVVPEEALLLELVNAKTSEAQARQEVDELKRSLAMSNRRHDAVLQQLRAEMEAAKAAAEVARLDAACASEAVVRAKEATDAARANESPSTNPWATPASLSVPTTPGAYDSDNKSLGALSDVMTPVDVTARPRKAETTPAVNSSGGGGWFWNRRSPSNTIKAAVTPSPE